MFGGQLDCYLIFVWPEWNTMIIFTNTRFSRIKHSFRSFLVQLVFNKEFLLLMLVVVILCILNKHDILYHSPLFHVLLEKCWPSVRIQIKRRPMEENAGLYMVWLSPLVYIILDYLICENENCILWHEMKKSKRNMKSVNWTFALWYISAVYQNQLISVCFTVYLLKIYLNAMKM